MSGGFQALALPDFRSLWLSRLISAMGSSIVPVATAFAVLRIGGSPGQLGLVLFCGAAAEVALLVVGGVWADRLHRRTVMLTADAVNGVLACLMGLLLLTDRAQVWHFGVLVMVGAVAKAFTRPASSGLVAELVPPGSRQSANALLSFCRSAPAVAGPAVAGLLVAMAGSGWAYLIDSASFVGSALLLARISLPDRPPKEHESFWHELRDGAKEVFDRPWLWQNLLSHGLWNLGFSMIFVLGPAVALARYGTVGAWAAVASGLAVGALVGGVLALRITPRRPLVAGNWALVAGAAPFLALACDVPIWVTASAAAVATAGLDVLGSLWNSTLQDLVPTEKMSRVAAYDWMLSLSITPLAYAAAGPLDSALGSTRALVVPALFIALPSMAVTFLPSVRSVRRTEDGGIEQIQYPVDPEAAAAVSTSEGP
ncbi:MFS transporter [Kitasatospora cineracea]|uniref:MFS transporter n=1 Tax=Kitasatospora cineracea TaxID=88074 RepID=UPI0033E8F1AB